MSGSTVVNEVEDLFQAGAVGLYEFIDIQRDAETNEAPPDAESLAREALERLTSSRGARMEWHDWANFGCHS